MMSDRLGKRSKSLRGFATRPPAHVRRRPWVHRHQKAQSPFWLHTPLSVIPSLMRPSITLNVLVSTISNTEIAVELHRTTPDGQDNYSDQIRASYDPRQLSFLEPDIPAYGKLLGAILFQGPTLSFLNETRSQALDRTAFLRIRIIINADDPVLNRILWERVVDPIRQDPLAVTYSTSLTRWVRGVAGNALPPVDVRPLKALIAIANPVDAGDYNLRALPPATLAPEIRNALYPFQCHILSERGPVTLAALAAALRDEEFDLLYLLAHGVSDGHAVSIVLQDDALRVCPISPEDMSLAICGGTNPRLVLLGSCSSANDPAGITNQKLPAALAPKLIRRGIPVVVGMNGPVTFDTATKYFGQFVKELWVEPDIDVASTEARRVIRNHLHQWPVPVVFSSVASGNIRWPRNALDAGPADDFQDWPLLQNAIKAGTCVPVLGPSVLETPEHARDAIRDLAARHGYPLAHHDDARRASVAQYIETNLGRSELIAQFGALFAQRFRATARAKNIDIDPNASVATLAAVLAQWANRNEPANLQRVLAQRPLGLYLTTDPFDTLEEAIRASGREPQSDFPRWKPDLVAVEPAPALRWRENPNRPLVFHLFGRWSHPDSLVLSDDNLLDFLLSVQASSAISTSIRAALIRSTLVFAGFPLSDWESHVVFRAVTARYTAPSAPEYAHVAAQVPPDTTWARNPVSAKNYLGAYFRQASVSVYWGSVSSFASEFETRTRLITHADE